jgi:NAD(P)-dependent dehydrogenase (short-subunit alcohol dehydrogenase family)
MELQDKVALITGGTMGLGEAIAIDLASRGAHIAVVARNLGDAAKAVEDKISSLGRDCHLVRADMTDADDCRRCVDETVAQFGRLDVLVSNAGGPSPGTLEQITPDQWLATMALHVNANYFLARAAVPHLRQQDEAAIITVSSSAGIRGCPGALAYCTAKGAVTQFTRALARDLADDNIRVNCVAPGVIRTRFHDDMPEERKQINLEKRIPLHREGTPQQVAEVVALLVTNDYITGETYSVDGGLTMRIV